MKTNPPVDELASKMHATKECDNKLDYLSRAIHPEHSAEIQVLKSGR